MDYKHDYGQSYVNLADTGFIDFGQSYDENFEWEQYLNDLLLTQPQADNAEGFLGPFQQNLHSSYTPVSDESTRAKRFTCGECGSQFEYKKDLERHVKSKHRRDGDSTYKCRCGKTDPRKDNHRRHVKKCKNRYLIGNSYTCVCGGEYANPDEYLGHTCVA
ncbi:hypothetical protein F5Y10DRAFT_290876 [Nemania abortiva]|nr:hypothetical protein F5Y10DRAFT_290876 [Nemania abortiva]